MPNNQRRPGGTVQRGPGQRRQDHPQTSPWQGEIACPLSAMPSKDLVGLAENMARRFVEHDIKTHQVRKILSALRSLESDLAGKTDLPPAKFLAEELPFLKARMAYAGTRSRIGEDQRHLDACIDAVQGPADFEKLIKFAEALVAYHKYHGGKETGR